MRTIIVLFSMVTILSANAARWSEEKSLYDVEMKSEALTEAYKIFNESGNNLNFQYSIDFWATTAKMESKKASEPLRNSIKQLQHINASDWYCNVSVHSDKNLRRDIRKSQVSRDVDTLFEIFDSEDVYYDNAAKKTFSHELYSVLKNNKLTYLGSTIYCTDEYAYTSIISIFDDATNEVLNLKVGLSD